jgi:hypothetical protein
MVSNSGRCGIFRRALQILTSRRNSLLISLPRDKLQRLQEQAVLTYPQLSANGTQFFLWNSLECYLLEYISEVVLTPQHFPSKFYLHFSSYRCQLIFCALYVSGIEYYYHSFIHSSLWLYSLRNRVHIR